MKPICKLISSAEDYMFLNKNMSFLRHCFSDTSFLWTASISFSLLPFIDGSFILQFYRYIFCLGFFFLPPSSTDGSFTSEFYPCIFLDKFFHSTFYIGHLASIVFLRHLFFSSTFLDGTFTLSIFYPPPSRWLFYIGVLPTYF